jgi:pimeloyl-ACP methyl ester carboxylesterase
MTIDPVSQLYFESSGPEGARSIVFLHGGGVGGWMWRGVVKNLQADFHCLVPDLPEQGRNIGAGGGPYTTEGAADRIATFIRSQAHGGQASVLGLSEGAQVVVALLSRHPEVIEAAVSSSAILRPLWANRFTTPGLVRWSYRLFMAPLKNSDWWIRTNMHGAAGITEEAYFPDFKADFQKMTEDSLVHMMVSSLNFRLPGGLDKADVPVLVVVGSKEYKEMKLSGLDLLKVLPKARGVMVDLGPKSSLAKEHNWAITAPDFFAATVRAWVSGQPLPAELKPLQF